MNSLRTRLIAGFSLVAVLPLALAMLLLSQRIQQTMQAQAAARLEAAVEVARSELASDGERLAARLRLLARDPELRRRLLVEPAGSLAFRTALEDERFLLGLDHLAVFDTAGYVLADASLAPRLGRAASPAEALPPAPDSGVSVLPLASGNALVLDAREPIRYDGATVAILRGGLRLDSLRVARLARTTGLDLVLRDAGGRVVSTTLAGGAMPAPRPGDASIGRVRLGDRAYFTRETALGADDAAAPAGWLVALAPTAPADDAIAVLRLTALALGGLGLLLAIVLGIVWSHQVSAPVERLAAVSERLSRGEWDDPVELESVRELRALVDALERMRLDLRRYRENLRASERQAAYGQMARRVAHEIKNPLTPIALSVAGLQRAHERGQPGFDQVLHETVRTVGEEVQRLKALLQEFGELGRFPPPRPTRFDVGELLGDLASLHAHDVEAGRLACRRPPGALPVDADRDQIRRALLNLVQNGLDAAGGSGHVTLTASAEGDRVRLAVSDDGPGLDDEQREQLFVPGFTTKTHGSGLGLTLVERIVADHGGTLDVTSAPGRGTTFVLHLPFRPEA